MVEPPSRRRLPRVIGFFQTRPNAPCITDPDEIRRSYTVKRWTTFTAVTLGYSFFYFTRLTLSVAKKPMIDSGVVNAEDLGRIGSLFLFVYAFGKLINGFLGDRAHIGRFMGVGLLVSAVINVLFPWSHSVVVFMLLWALNGWFLSMGSAPSVVNIAAWFSRKERGTRYSIWSLAHNMGEGMTFIITANIVLILGWKSGFWLPGVICIFVGLTLFLTILDRPPTYGLPPIAEYKGEDPMPIDRNEDTVAQQQLKVLKDPAIWVLGLASACVYVSRYGINSWFVMYLQEAKSCDIVKAGFTTSFASIIGATGTLAAGPVSDYLFNGKRIPVCLMYGVLLIGGLIAIPLIPPGQIWADCVAMSACGFAIGGLLVFLGGLVAVDISSKQAAGAAMGFIGMVSYLGAGVGDWVAGYLLEAHKTIVNGKTVYHFDTVLLFWIGSAIISFLLTASLWRVKRTST